MGKPTGWGGPWWESDVQASDQSDPFLMTGFDKKVDFLGNGTWVPYETVTVPPEGYAFHPFPDAFSAHWVCMRVNTAGRATVYFVYS